MISRRITIIALLLIAVLVILGLYQHAVHGHLPPPERLRLSAAKVTVPLTFFGGRPVVDVKVNGKGPFRFICDTGAAGKKRSGVRGLLVPPIYLRPCVSSVSVRSFDAVR